MKVLIIEDSPEVAESISLCLQIRWPEVELSAAAEGAKGLEMAKSENFDLVLLDINLPDIDGFNVLNQIRSFSKVPIIIVTVRGNEHDQVRGLEMGADDYIVKPFRPRDLIARANAVLRRTQDFEVTEEQPLIIRGDLTLNLTTDEALLHGRTTRLTRTEAKVLYVLMKSAEKTLNDEELFQKVWNKNYSDSQVLRSYIRRLRDKLNDNPPRIILTKRGEGYRFVSPS
ncbi:MAG: response regulator transcription factor [Chloroflexota bacterium]